VSRVWNWGSKKSCLCNPRQTYTCQRKEIKRLNSTEGFADQPDRQQQQSCLKISSYQQFPVWKTNEVSLYSSEFCRWKKKTCLAIPSRKTSLFGKKPEGYIDKEPRHSFSKHTKWRCSDLQRDTFSTSNQTSWTSGDRTCQRW